MWLNSSNRSPKFQHLETRSESAQPVPKDGGRVLGKQYVPVSTVPVVGSQPLQDQFAPTLVQQTVTYPRHGILRDWWLEIEACIVAIGFIIAIFATLYPYASRTLPQWPYGLTINSLISIYIMILKAVTLLTYL